MSGSKLSNFCKFYFAKKLPTINKTDSAVSNFILNLLLCLDIIKLTKFSSSLNRFKKIHEIKLSQAVIEESSLHRKNTQSQCLVGKHFEI